MNEKQDKMTHRCLDYPEERDHGTSRDKPVKEELVGQRHESDRQTSPGRISSEETDNTDVRTHGGENQNPHVRGGLSSVQLESLLDDDCELSEETKQTSAEHIPNTNPVPEQSQLQPSSRGENPAAVRSSQPNFSPRSALRKRRKKKPLLLPSAFDYDDDYDIKLQKEKESKKTVEADSGPQPHKHDEQSFSWKTDNISTKQPVSQPKDSKHGYSRLVNTPFGLRLCSYSSFIGPSVSASSSLDSSHPVWHQSTSSTGEILKHDESGQFSVQSESLSDDVSELSGEVELQAVNVISTLNIKPEHSELQLSSRDSFMTSKVSYLPRCPSMSSLSQIPVTKNKLTRSNSLPDMKLKTSFEEFTPDITVDEDDETYRFQCSCPGLYQCSVTGLVFHMEAKGDVVYRTLDWNTRLLDQHHKKPAGPLFDIKCLQQSVCQLHLPHCEIRSTGGCQFLSVAHVKDEGIEFISPHKITETHVVINITGFSGFGNVKEENSPPDPVRVLVLLFYTPATDLVQRSFLNVLLVPGNVVLRDVQHFRKKYIGDEVYIESSPHCNLQPNQFYRLITRPQDRRFIKIQPRKVQFDEEHHRNYFTSFQVILKTTIRKIKMSLEDKDSLTVWKRRVYLPTTIERKSPEQRFLNVSPDNRLFHVRSRFIKAISGPVLKSLMDKLLEKKVITDSERESVDAEKTREDKARFVIDTVRNKGKAASSLMIRCFHEVDPYVCEHLGLM